MLARLQQFTTLSLLAIALAVPPKRSSSALGLFLAIIMLVTQHKINEYAEGFGGLGGIDPFIALWVPFLFFCGLAFWMYYVLAYVPGGQPIGALERSFAKFAAWIKRLWRRLPLLRDMHGDFNAKGAA